MSYGEELATATKAAREAGEIMANYRESGFSIERKESYTNIVTEADRACQEAIIEIIRERFPEDGFLAEEDGQTPDGEERVWVIDPIDGTKNFAHGFPFYCASIGLKAGGERKVGVVYWPWQDELFHAVAGKGAFRDGEELSVSAVETLKDALVITRLSDWGEQVQEREARFLIDLLSTPSSFRRPGCAALDLCLVASGAVDAHALLTIHEWDIAAGALIVKEAGGTIRIDDAMYDGYLEIIASNGAIQDQLEEVFDRHVQR